MNPLDAFWGIIKTMPPGERRRVESMEGRGLKPAPKDIYNRFNPQPPNENEHGMPSPNDYISWEQARDPSSQRDVTQEDWDNLNNPPLKPNAYSELGTFPRPKTTPERVGPGDMTPDAIMRYTKPQLVQMIQLIHNELGRRQSGKVGVR